MVRYARSYASGNKKPQEATPWEQMATVLKNDTQDRVKNHKVSGTWPQSSKSHALKKYKDRANISIGAGLNDFTFDSTSIDGYDNTTGLAAQLTSIAPIPPALEKVDIVKNMNSTKIEKMSNEKHLTSDKVQKKRKKKQMKTKNTVQMNKLKANKHSKDKFIAKKKIIDEVEKIKDTLIQLSKEDEEHLKEFVRKDHRREERRLKRMEEKQSSTICFQCRKSGHTISECPQASTDLEQGTGICFKCGSTEHTVHQCKVKLPSGEYPYAKCFICKEMGHLSNQCPDNPRGLYPKGGCCKLCGSVEHYKKACPVQQQQQGIDDIKLSVINTFSSADEEVTFKHFIPQFKKKGPKIVKF